MMMGMRKTALSLAVAVLAAIGARSASALPLITNISDTGDLRTNLLITSPPPPALLTSDVSVAKPYGSSLLTVTPVTSGATIIGYQLEFQPTGGFYASANNLTGGMTTAFSGDLSFDISFLEGPVNLTTNVVESGMYHVSGNGVALANSPLLASGVTVKPTTGTAHTSLFSSNASTLFGADGGWTLFDQLPASGSTFATYHINIDNDLLAESDASATPGSAVIYKKNFSIFFTFDGSNGGSGPPAPEPASLGILALGTVALVARRRR